MKKIWFSITILTLLSLFFATTQVLASPASLIDPKKTPVHTPGARATDRANERATQGVGNSQGVGNPHGVGNLHGKRLNYRGVIAAADASSLTLTLYDGSSLTFLLAADTRIHVPTLGQSSTITNLLTGMQVNVQATQDVTGALTAIKVLVVPGKPTLFHRVGTVTDYQPGISITIQAKDGNLFTFMLTADTRILPVELADKLAVGVCVTIISPRDVTGGPLTAKAIVIHLPGIVETATP
jgi:hypothetical protein